MADMNHTLQRDMQALSQAAETITKASEGLGIALEHLAAITASNAEAREKREKEEQTRASENLAADNVEKKAKKSFLNLSRKEQQEELKIQRKKSEQNQKELEEQIARLRTTTGLNEEEEKQRQRLITSKKRELSAEKENAAAKKELLNEYKLTTRAIKSVKSEWTKVADTRVGKGFLAINKGLGVILGASGAAAGIISVLNSSNKAFVNIARSAGISVSAGGAMADSFTQSSEALARMGYSMEEMGQTATAAIAAIGSTAAVTSDAMEFIGASAKVFGMSIDESAGAFKTLSITMGLGASHAADFANTLKNDATSAGVSASLVYRDMANFAAKTSESFGMTPQQLKNATIRAKQLGTTIDEISGASKNFTTMESSLEMTQKAGLLFGAKMNALELTRLARAGKIEQVQDRVLDAVQKQVDANGEIQITDVAQAELLEKMLGKDWKNILKARHMERRIARDVKVAEQDRGLALQIAMRDTVKWNKMTASQRNEAIKKEKQQIENSKDLNELAESYQGAWDRIKSLFISYIQPSLQSFAMWLTEASDNGSVLVRVFDSIKNTLEKIGPLLRTMKDNPILSALGLGGSIVGVRAAYKKLMGKGDGSRANPFYVRIAGGIPGLENMVGADGKPGTGPGSVIRDKGRDAYRGAREAGASRTKAMGQSMKAVRAAWKEMGGLKTLVQATSRLPAVGTLMKIATVGSLFMAGKTLTGDEATGKEKASTVGGLAGGLAGAAAGTKLGGIIGTFFGPGVGTAIGAGIGGVIGGVGGALGAEVIAEKVFDWWKESGVGEKISNTWNKVTGHISKIWKKITDPWIPVIKNIKRIWSQIKILFNLFVIEPAKQLWEDFKNKIEKYILKPAEKLWKYFKDSAKEYVFDPAQKAWGWFKGLAQEYVFDPAMEVWNYFKINFIDPITEVAMSTFGYFSELIDDITEMFDFDLSEALSWGDDKNKEVSGDAADKTAGISGWLQSLIDSKQQETAPGKSEAFKKSLPTSVSEVEVGGRSAQQLADEYGVDISQGAYGFSADQIRNMDPQKIKDYLQKNGIETLDQMSKSQMAKMFLQAQMGKFNVSKNAKGGRYGGDVTPKPTNDMGEKVNGAQLALVGEENKDEVIIPTQRIREGKPINAEVAEELKSIGVPGFMRGRRSMTRGGASNAAAQISLERSALALETSASDIKAQEALMKDAIEHSTEVADAQFNHMQKMWEEEEQREKAKEPFDWSLFEVLGAHLVAAEGVINSNAELLQGWGTVGNWLVDNSRLIGDVGRFLMAKDKKEAAIQIALSALTTKIMESIGGGDGADAGKLFAANMASGMKPMNAALSSMSSVFDKDRQARETLNAKIQAAQAQETQLKLQAAQMGYNETEQAAFAAQHMDETAKEFAKLKVAEAPANIALKEAAGEFATGTLAMIEGGMSLKDAAKQQGIMMLKQYALRKIEHIFSKTEFGWEKAKVLWQKIFQAKEQIIQAKEMAIQTQKGAASLLSGGAKMAGAGAGAAGAGAGAGAAGGAGGAGGGLAAALGPIIVPLLVVIAVMAALYLIIKHWKSIIKFLKKVVTYIGKIFKLMGRMFAKIGMAVWNAIKPVIKPLFDVLTFIPRKIIGFFKKMWKAIKKVIPGLAAGGVITKPTQVMVGETNEKEVVVPVERIRNGGEVNPAVMAEMNALVPYLTANNSSNTKTNNSGESNEALINEIRALRAEIAAVAERPISISMDGKKVADVVGERFNRMANNY